MLKSWQLTEGQYRSPNYQKPLVSQRTYENLGILKVANRDIILGGGEFASLSSLVLYGQHGDQNDQMNLNDMTKSRLYQDYDQ